MGATRITKFSGIPNPGRTVSILVRASNKLVMEEADRSIHDAMCVIRCLVKEKCVSTRWSWIALWLQLRRSCNTFELNVFSSRGSYSMVMSTRWPWICALDASLRSVSACFEPAGSVPHCGYIYPRALIAGGGAPEIQMSTELAAYSQVGTWGNRIDMQAS
jgi:chaperonin GroEL (HSP60 family)